MCRTPYYLKEVQDNIHSLFTVCEISVDFSLFYQSVSEQVTHTFPELIQYAVNIYFFFRPYVALVKLERLTHGGAKIVREQKEIVQSIYSQVLEKEGR